jgi:hypothetical protein
VTTSATILAQEDAFVLLRALLIGLVIVSPFWFWQRRKIRREREALAGPPEPEPESDPNELATVLAGITAQADAAETLDAITIKVPNRLLQDGKPIDPALADTLIRDTLKRCGLTATAEFDTNDARHIECVKRSGT